MTTHNACATCGGPVPPAPRAWDEDDAPANLFCSIHCEHYHGLARAAAHHSFAS